MSASTDPIAAQPLGEFLAALASAEPVPGGGAAAAVSAALAASLTAMVVRLSLDRPKYAEFEELHTVALAASDAARMRFLELAEEDATAYAAYRAARSLPRETQSEIEARDAAARACREDRSERTAGGRQGSATRRWTSSIVWPAAPTSTSPAIWRSPRSCSTVLLVRPRSTFAPTCPRSAMRATPAPSAQSSASGSSRSRARPTAPASASRKARFGDSPGSRPRGSAPSRRDEREGDHQAQHGTACGIGPGDQVYRTQRLGGRSVSVPVVVPVGRGGVAGFGSRHVPSIGHRHEPSASVTRSSTVSSSLTVESGSERMISRPDSQAARSTAPSPCSAA